MSLEEAKTQWNDSQTAYETAKREKMVAYAEFTKAQRTRDLDHIHIATDRWFDAQTEYDLAKAAKRTAYESYTMAQRADREARAAAQAKKYQAKRRASTVDETPEEREARIIDEQHAKNMQDAIQGPRDLRSAWQREQDEKNGVIYDPGAEQRAREAWAQQLKDLEDAGKARLKSERKKVEE